MTRSHREELNRKLALARRLALEPTDPLTRERLAQLIAHTWRSWLLCWQPAR